MNVPGPSLRAPPVNGETFNPDVTDPSGRSTTESDHLWGGTGATAEDDHQGLCWGDLLAETLREFEGIHS